MSFVDLPPICPSTPQARSGRTFALRHASSRSLRARVLVFGLRLASALATALAVVQPVGATGLSPVGTDTDVFIESLRYDLQVRGHFVAGRMEVQFSARFGGPSQGILRFPLPPGAVIHRAELYVPAEDRWEMAQTLGRREGSVLNDEAKGDPETPEPDDPLLLQAIGPDFYRAQVFPIDASAALRIRVYYAHALELSEQGLWNLRLAQANRDATSSTPAQGMTVHIVTAPAAYRAGQWSGLATAIPGSVNWHDGMDQGTSTLTVTQSLLDQDLVLPLTPTVPLPATATLRWDSPHQNLGSHTFGQWWLSSAQVQEVEALQASPRRIVFVVDTSGSMNGSKIQQTKRALHAALDGLAEGDSFGLVAFANQTRVFAPSLVGREHIAAAHTWVDGLQANGGTGMAGGVSSALDLFRDSTDGETATLLLLTDGLPTDGSNASSLVSQVLQASEQLQRRLRVFALGIGTDLDQRFLNELVAPLAGVARFALADNAIAGHAQELFALTAGGGLDQATLALVANDAKIGEQSWVRWLAKPLTFAGRPLQSAALSVHFTGINDHGVSVTLQSAVAAPDPQVNGYLASLAAPLAAKAVADQLERDIDRLGENDERVQDAVAHAKRFGIVTRYSSLLALDEPQLYDELGIERLPRDAAGIALRDPLASQSQENQIGGEGAHDDPQSDDDDDDDDDGENDAQNDAEEDASSPNGEASMGCRVGRPHTWQLWPLALLVIGLGRRRQPTILDSSPEPPVGLIDTRRR